MSGLQLRYMTSAADFQACFPLLHTLRPHIGTAAELVRRLSHQATQGYRLLAAMQGDTVAGVAGFRCSDNLLYGRFLYLDDLVVRAGEYGCGTGTLLLRTVQEEAGKQGCRHLVLDTALGNALAQRFYFRHGLLSRGLHFSQAVGASQ